jgi:hypothetical protein
MSDLMLTNLELRVLRAVDNRPGVTSLGHVTATDLDQEIIDLALEHLERAGLVHSNTIWRTGAVSWRITRAGVDELVAAPPRRLRRGRKQPALQFEIGDVL